MDINSRPPAYRILLFSFWQEPGRDPQGDAVWRFSLEEPRTGQRQGFATLEELVEVLRSKMQTAAKD